MWEPLTSSRSRPHPEARWTRGSHGLGYIDQYGDVHTWNVPDTPTHEHARAAAPRQGYAHFILTPGGHVDAKLLGNMAMTEFYRLLNQAHPDAAPKWTRQAMWVDTESVDSNDERVLSFNYAADEDREDQERHDWRDADDDDSSLRGVRHDGHARGGQVRRMPGLLPREQPRLGAGKHNDPAARFMAGIPHWEPDHTRDHRRWQYTAPDGILHRVGCGSASHTDSQAQRVDADRIRQRVRRCEQNACQCAQRQVAMAPLPTPEQRPLRPGDRVVYEGHEYYLTEMDGALAVIVNAQGEDEIVPVPELRAANTAERPVQPAVDHDAPMALELYHWLKSHGGEGRAGDPSSGEDDTIPWSDPAPAVTANTFEAPSLGFEAVPERGTRVRDRMTNLEGTVVFADPAGERVLVLWDNGQQSARPITRLVIGATLTDDINVPEFAEPYAAVTQPGQPIQQPTPEQSIWQQIGHAVEEGNIEQAKNLYRRLPPHLRPLSLASVVYGSMAHIGEYRGLHTAPSEHNGVPLHAMDGHARDIYEHPEYFLDGTEHDMDSVREILKVRNRPDAMVTIHRATPGHGEINTGDWVTLSHGYATRHGMHPDDPTKDWPVYSAQVPASSLWWDGNSINEFGYSGPNVPHDPSAGIHRPLDGTP